MAAKETGTRRAAGGRGPGQRAGLTRAAVLAAAHQLVAERGVPGLTMRALAQRLAVAPNALYSHVGGKAELVDELLDDLLARVEEPDPQRTEPADGLFTVMRSTYEVLTAHPSLVPAYLARQGARGANAVRLGGIMDALLTRAGIEGGAGAEARRVLIIHAIGWAAFATGPGSETAGAMAGTQPVPAHRDPQATFERSLRWLLAGITAPAG